MIELFPRESDDRYMRTEKWFALVVISGLIFSFGYLFGKHMTAGVVHVVLRNNADSLDAAADEAARRNPASPQLSERLREAAGTLREVNRDVKNKL